MHIAASSYLVYKSSLYFSSFETMMYCDKHDSTQTEGALSKKKLQEIFRGFRKHTYTSFSTLSGKTFLQPIYSNQRVVEY